MRATPPMPMPTKRAATATSTHRTAPTRSSSAPDTAPSSASRWRSKIATDAQIIPIIFKGAKEIAAYGDTHRLATANQRLALIARDKGCSFPGCSIPPAWCQTHHITDYQFSRRTSVDDLTLLCGYHHRTFEKLGWTCQMIKGFPHWTPPPWANDRTPRRNTAHI